MEHIGILGGGIMGCGIAQVALLGGYSVILYDNNSEALQKGVKSIKKN